MKVTFAWMVAATLALMTPHVRAGWVPADKGSVWCSGPAIGQDNTIYVGNDEWLPPRLRAWSPFDPTDPIWSVGLGEIADPPWNKIETGIPAVGPDGTIYIGLALSNSGPVTGRVVAVPVNGPGWRFDVPSSYVYTTPAIGTDGTIYAGSEDGHLYAIDPITGMQNWTYAASPNGLPPVQPVKCSAAIGADETIYFGAGPYFFGVTLTGGARFAPVSILG